MKIHVSNIYFLTIILLLMIFLCSKTVGQVRISGTITDKSKVPLRDINVILSSTGQNNILSYSLSDGNGKYVLNYTGSEDSLQITLRSLSYEKVVRVISNKTQTIDFELKEDVIEIKEVKVTAPPIRESGDTITYVVSNFVSESDRVIEDVLKKLPGIEVSESGRITYQGKDINKLYIENMDLLRGRYVLATKNISAKDVAAVEVYENHQPIRALSNTDFSDKAAINLKLREDAKGVLNVLMQLGIGAEPFLWDNELISLFFSKKYQNINTYKCNNSGNDVIREFTAFYSDAEPLAFEGRLLSVLEPNPPPINRQRYLFNNTHAASVNVLHAFNKDNHVTANVMYYNDIQKKESYSRSSYYLDSDSSLVVEESLNNKTMMNNIASTINLESNKDKFFLNNVINFNMSLIDSRGNSETIDTVGQRLKTDVYYLANKLELIKNLKDLNTIRLYSFNGYSQTPQNLSIMPASYIQIFDSDQSIVEINQHTTFNNYTSKTYLTYSIFDSRLMQFYWCGFEADVHSLNSQLQLPQNNNFFIPDSFKNNLLWQKYITQINASYTYSVQKFRIELALPLNYTVLFIDNKYSENRKTINRIFFNPSFNVIYNFTRNWSAKTGFGYYNGLGNIQSIYTGYIMRNYRSLSRNDGHLAESKSYAVYLHTNYRNVSKSFFTHTNVFYEQYNSNLLYENNYNGILLIQNSVPQSFTSKTYGASGNVSKSVYPIKTTFSLTGNFYNVASAQLIQNRLVDFRYIYYTFRPKIDMNISSFSGLSYTLLWNESKNIIEKTDNPWIRSISNYIKLNAYPVNLLEIFIGYENYYNNTISNKKSRSFADLGVNYRYKNIDLSLTWLNILNMHQYNTAIYADLNEFINVYEIRPSQVLLKVKFKLL